MFLLLIYLSEQCHREYARKIFQPLRSQTHTLVLLAVPPSKVFRRPWYLQQRGEGQRGRNKKDDVCIVPSLPTLGTTPIPPCDRAGCSEGGGTSSGAASSEGAPLGWVEESREGGGEPTSLWETAQLCLQVPRQRWSGRHLLLSMVLLNQWAVLCIVQYHLACG